MPLLINGERIDLARPTGDVIRAYPHLEVRRRRETARWWGPAEELRGGGARGETCLPGRAKREAARAEVTRPGAARRGGARLCTARSPRRGEAEARADCRCRGGLAVVPGGEGRRGGVCAARPPRARRAGGCIGRAGLPLSVRNQQKRVIAAQIVISRQVLTALSVYKCGNPKRGL